MRQAFRAQMGIVGLTKLPEPEYDQRRNPIYEVKVNGQNCLRPAWKRDWDVNEEAWGGDLVWLIQADGHKYMKNLLQDDILAIAPAEILEAVHQTFRSYQWRWVQEKDDIEEQKAKQKIGRSNQRKRKVCHINISSLALTLIATS